MMTRSQSLIGYDEDFDLLQQSIQVARSVVIDILKRSRLQLMENFAMKCTNGYSIECSLFMAAIAAQICCQKEDFEEQIKEDDEPIPLPTDAWRSYILDVDLRFDVDPTPHASTVRNLTNHSIYRQSMVKVTKRASIQMEPTPEVPLTIINLEGEPIPDDPFENGLRSACERDSRLKLQKMLMEQQRATEKKEQQRQMRVLASSITAKAYTFEYDGRLMAQQEPKLESGIQQKMKSDVKLANVSTHFEFGRSFSQNKIQKTRSVQIMENVYAQRPDQGLLESIKVARGVTIYDGNSSISGPTFKNNIKQTNAIKDPSLHLTKSEYKSIVGMQIANPINLTNQEQITQQSIIFDTMRDKKVLNSSMGQVSSIYGGSIRVHNDSYVDDLIIEDPMPIIPAKKSSFALNNEAPKRDHIIQRQSVPKLPKVLYSDHSLPSLVKVPRSRVLSQILISKSHKHLKSFIS